MLSRHLIFFWYASVFRMVSSYYAEPMISPHSFSSARDRNIRTSTIARIRLQQKAQDATFFLFLYYSHFYFPDSGQAVVTGVVPSSPLFSPEKRRMLDYFFIIIPHTSTFQLLLDKPWFQVLSLPPPRSFVQFFSRIGFSNPTARRLFIKCC